MGLIRRSLHGLYGAYNCCILKIHLYGRVRNRSSYVRPLLKWQEQRDLTRDQRRTHERKALIAAPPTARVEGLYPPTICELLLPKTM